MVTKGFTFEVFKYIIWAIFARQIATDVVLFQSKKRGLSLEEKRTRLLELFFEKVRVLVLIKKLEYFSTLSRLFSLC